MLAKRLDDTFDEPNLKINLIFGGFFKDKELAGLQQDGSMQDGQGKSG